MATTTIARTTVTTETLGCFSSNKAVAFQFTSSSSSLLSRTTINNNTFKQHSRSINIYYVTRINSSATTFGGPARLFGLGGLGAFAVRLGRVAVVLARKYVSPAAREVGKQLLNATIPELGNVLAGRKRPSKKLLANVKSAAEKKSKNFQFSATCSKLLKKASGARAACNGAGGWGRPESNFPQTSSKQNHFQKIVCKEKSGGYIVCRPVPKLANSSSI